MRLSVIVYDDKEKMLNRKPLFEKFKNDIDILRMESNLEDYFFQENLYSIIKELKTDYIWLIYDINLLSERKIKKVLKLIKKNMDKTDVFKFKGIKYKKIGVKKVEDIHDIIPDTNLIFKRSEKLLIENDNFEKYFSNLILQRKNYYSSNHFVESEKFNTSFNFEYRGKRLIEIFLEVLNFTNNNVFLQKLILKELIKKIENKEFFYFDEKKDILKPLINKINIEVFKNIKNIDRFHLEYLLNLREVEIVEVKDKFAVLVDDYKYYENKVFELIFSNYQITETEIKFLIFPKILFLTHLDYEFILQINGKEEILDGKESAYSYHRCREKTNDFKAYKLCLNLKPEMKFKLLIRTEEQEYQFNKFYYTNDFHQLTKNTSINDGEFLIKDIKLDSKQKLWLYQDRNDILDNAYQQFIHDMKCCDGIKKIYCTENKEVLKLYPKNTIKYGSRKHKKYLQKSAKILTSFNNKDTIFPFKKQNIKYKEIIYLQHGILHAHAPWIYGKEKNIFNKIVISSDFEYNNFINNYGYEKEDLIYTGMPKLSNYQKKQKKTKNLRFYLPHHGEKNFYLLKQENLIEISLKNHNIKKV